MSDTVEVNAETFLKVVDGYKSELSAARKAIYNLNMRRYELVKRLAEYENVETNRLEKDTHALMLALRFNPGAKVEVAI